MLTNCLAACAHLTITVSEIQRYICEKIVILSYPLAFHAPVRGVPVGISAPPMVKKFRRYLYSFWRDPRTWQTDEQTDRHCMTAKIALASHRAVIKLEWCGYPIAKKIRRYVYSFRQNIRTWRTDGHTDTTRRHRPRLCIASRGTNRPDHDLHYFHL